MRNFFKIVSILALLVFQFDLSAQSVLHSGNWFKFSVASDGVVKIDYKLLKSTGINPDQVDPRNIKIYAAQNGMLPQAISAPRKNTLSQIAIQVVGESDGKFNAGDYILFYGQGPDTYQYNTQKKMFEYENNLYSDKNFYFLTVNAEPSNRIAAGENINGTFPIISDYEDIGYYETDKYNILKSGRHWFGEQFDSNKEATIRFDISGVIENSEISLVSHVMAQSVNNSSFQLSFNNNPVLTQPIDPIPNTRYGVKGVIKADTVIINSNTVGAPGRNNQDIKYQFTKGSLGLSVGYLDFIIMTIKRKLALYGDQAIFRSSSSLSNSISTFEIESASANTFVWDVTDPFLVIDQQFTNANSKINFSTNSQVLKTFTVFSTTNLKAPAFDGAIPNQNVAAIGTPAFLIITHPDFISEAQRLANHRQNKSGISVGVVNINQIYNEYSGGKQDITALRDFIKEVYSSNSFLKNVLLFGRGSYDYKNRVLGNTNYIPIYESRNSLSPLETYASDDYLTFLEPNEGEWGEKPAQNHTMDIGIGRLPVKKLEEAKIIVDKIIECETNPSAFGTWQNEILFVADDGDNNIHNTQADQLANSIEVLNPNYTANKFFLDSYDQITQQNSGNQSSPEANKAVDLAIRKTPLIVNYTGHGSERVWMDERILDETLIKSWHNAPRYPLFITATCEFGRHDDPLQITSGELTLLQKKGGGIGIVTSARPVNSSTNFTLNKAFYESLFSKENNKYKSMGTVFRETKNNSISGVANRNFSLLGDPSMTLALAENQIVFDEIKTSDGSSELKGLSTVKVIGHIENETVIQTSFNGNISLTLFDKEVNAVTKGDENPPFNYTTRSNSLFRGNSTVNQGSFEMEFIMPKNISTEFVTGKFIAFASTKAGQLANGNSLNTIGGLEPSANVDATPPTIQLFLGDTTFIAGGIVGPNTQIVAHLYDNSGINISSNPTGNEITASIDGGQSFILNDYYSANTNTYKKGVLTFPLEDLEKGKHTLTLSASDTYNNRQTSTVDFVVTDGVQIQVEAFTNYPNPFSGSTTLEFTHTRPGEDLEAFVTIYDMVGNVLLNQSFEITNSQYRVTLADWDGKSAHGTKLSNGIYVGKVSVRSLLDGSKNEQFTKLIILN